ncbi:MAG: hypothetical protein H7833_11600 [Magnetococcus sp. DMHC-1]|nr:hypothetical protein [Magnetococcales bacterium]
MDKVATALKGLDEDYTIELRNGKKLTRNNLSIRKTVRVGAVGGHPNLIEIYSEMSVWLRELIGEGVAIRE